MSLKGIASNALRVFLIVSVASVQGYLFPSYIVLFCTLVYVLFCCMHVLHLLTTPPESGTVYFPLLLHGYAPSNYVLTIANTMFLYQVLYLVCFLYVCTRDGFVCGKMYPENDKCTLLEKGSGVTWCVPKNRQTHTMLPVPTDPFMDIDCTDTWKCYVVGLGLNASLALRPMHSLHMELVLHGSDCAHTNALVRYNDESHWKTLSMTCDHVDKHGTHIAPIPHTTKKTPTFVATPRVFNGSVLLSTEYIQPAPIMQLFLLHSPSRTWETRSKLHQSLVIPTIAVASSVAGICYLAAFNAFQNVVRHTTSALFLYICVPMIVLFNQTGSWASLVAALLLSASIIKCCSAQAAPRRVMAWLAVVLALLESAYLVYVAVTEHLQTDLQWKSTRTNLHTLSQESTVVDDIFWGRRRDAFEEFLFYPGLILSLYCAISAACVALTI